jgi:hypothetical protein
VRTVRSVSQPGKPPGQTSRSQPMRRRPVPNRVLQECGLEPVETEESFAPARNKDIEETILRSLLVTVGECTIIADGRPEVARVGDAVIVARGIRHAIKHNGGQPCQVIAVLASADVQIGMAT